MQEDRIRKHYEPLISPDSDGFEVADWGDAASQLKRFEVLAANADLAGRSLLDVGCGTGDLSAFLATRDLAVDYLGVDLLDKMIDEARRRHPTAAFESLDPFDPAALASRRFDVVFASGVFNLETGNSREFLPAGIDHLLGLADEALVFNLLHARADKHYDHCVYYTPQQIAAILDPLPCDWRVVDDYLPNDFTVICTPR
jgi:cyclopropane fatty-acyl-phospholipid synthase-like methyltransferase